MSSDLPDKQTIKNSDEMRDNSNKDSEKLYGELVDRLCDLVEQEESLHWLHYNMCLTMLCAMLRWDVVFPARAVNIFTNNLLHDNVMVRTASFHVVDCVLKQHKRKHLKIKLINSNRASNGDKNLVNGNGDSNTNGQYADMSQVLLVQPGERSDNKWLQYSPDNKPLDQESYDEPRYLHRNYYGFYIWPQEDLVYAPSSQQPSLDRNSEDMPEPERIIYAFFCDEKNVQKLVEFLSLEEKKGKDYFAVERFGMFKALFRNFGDSFLSLFRPHIEKLVADHRESHQRAAAEMIAGLIRGSKHWGYQKAEAMWSWVTPTLKQALIKVSPETIRDWGTCFATSSDNRDPNKLHWLMEVAMEEPIRSQGSFIDCSRLYMLQGVLAQQKWRVGDLLHRLLAFLMPFLDHPYHNVRLVFIEILVPTFFKI